MSIFGDTSIFQQRKPAKPYVYPEGLMRGYLPGSIMDKVGPEAQYIFDIYLDNICGYINKTTVRDKYGNQSQPDEVYMRQIEECCDIKEAGADDFRRQIAAFVGHLHIKGQKPKWDSNPMLGHGIISYIAEHRKEVLEVPQPVRKYRNTDDPWEPAW